MEFIKNVFINRKIIWGIGKNDFKNRFANTSLGAIWGFLQPFIFMLTYVIVFQYILKVGSVGNYPYVSWYLPAMSMWMTLNDSIISASNSIRAYSYLVKKVIFPVDTIPVISIIASSFVSMFLFIIAIVVSSIFGYFPNLLILLYAVFAMYCFVIALTRFTSAVVTVLPDFSQLLNIVMQLFFWFTPIVWDMQRIAGHPTIARVLQCIPFTYLVSAARQAFIHENIITKGHGIYTIIFWVITIVLFVWGNHVFKKTRKDFSDVL
ncbi:MAG: ABC transporter permease [Clostridia bacterium]|nr:ABC transporter permease [Clostridia bacterium]